MDNEKKVEEDKKEKKETNTLADKLRENQFPIGFSIAIVFFLALRLAIKSSSTALFFNVVLIASAAFFVIFAFTQRGDIKKNRMYLIPAVFAIIVLYISFLPQLGAASAEDFSALSSTTQFYYLHTTLLLTLFTGYYVLSILASSKILKTRYAVLIALILTAIIFRAVPAFPEANPGGDLLSFDDPYYHYKQTEKLYSQGEIPERDYLIYPPEGRNAPHKFSYYFTAFFANMAGVSIHDAIMLYPIFAAIMAVVFLFFFMKNITKDWKVGALAAFFFATMPIILSKSVVGGVEEDIMGMAMAFMSLFFLSKALQSEGQRNTIFSILTGLSFFMTLLSWKGVDYLFALPFAAIALYILGAAALGKDTWNTTKTLTISGLIMVGLEMLILSNGELSLIRIAPVGAAILIGFLAEAVHQSGGLKKIKHADTAVLVFGLMIPLFLALLMSFTLISIDVMVMLVVGSIAIAMLVLLALIIKNFSLKDSTDLKKTPGWEEKIRKASPMIAVVLLILVLAFVAIKGIDTIINLPTNFYENFAGTSGHNFLVDKTIQEQSALATGGLTDKLATGYTRFGVAEVLSLVSAVLVFFVLLYQLYSKKAEEFLKTLLPYVLCIMFLAVTMNFVWIEARLGFSQSVGFILMGSLIALFLPKSMKELESWKVIVLMILILAVPFTTFYPHSVSGSGTVDSWSQTMMTSSVWIPWTMATDWMAANILEEDYVLTWWDYGHAITALAKRTVIADPLQAGEDYIMQIAHFFYNTSSEAEAVEWLEEQPWNVDRDGNGRKVRYIVLDKTLVDKASALAFLGTNYYEYPNGAEIVNGTCSSGIMCQNVYNGIDAVQNEEGEFTCSKGVVCPTDNKLQLSSRQCCDPTPQCCNTSFDWHVIETDNGAPVAVISNREAVFGQYELDTSNAACKSHYMTTSEPMIIVEDGERKTIVESLLYTGGGPKFADGNYYVAIVIQTYDDGTQDIKLLTPSCGETSYSDIVANYGDRIVPMQLSTAFNGEYIQRMFAHVPEKWQNSMFAKLYFEDAEDLDYFELILDDQTQQFYPYVKLYKVSYPGEVEISDEPDEPVIEEAVVKDGDRVLAHYTGRLSDGSIFDTSLGDEPIDFVMGSGDIIPGFEEGIMGMSLGEERTFIVPPELAYGVNGSNPLAGEYLEFTVQVLGINDLELIENETEKEYDIYDPSLYETYLVDGTPTVVWNCRYSKEGSFVLGEGTEVEPGKELKSLVQLTCMFNNAEPTELCAQYGIVKDEDNQIQASIAQDLVENLKRTGQENCKPEDSTEIAVFHSPTDENSIAQRPILEELKEMFGDSVDITYYCAGSLEDCVKLSEEVRL